MLDIARLRQNARKPAAVRAHGWRDMLAPAAIGLAAFLSVLGASVLDPRNIGWLTRGDSPAQFIGWEFFRHAAWQLPLGSTPGYGLYLGGSVVYSDSIPLLAIPAKVLGPWLPEPFQYFGIWLLVCFLLQALFAWKLVGLYTNSISALAIATAFFAFAPTMIWRMDPRISQWSLGGQFLVTAALYIALDRGARRPWLRWTALLAVATAIHAYLLGMAMAIWCADLVRRRHDRVTSADAMQSLVVPVFSVFATAWLVGYTSIGSGSAAYGYGTFKATPFALFDPGKGSVGIWSRVIPDVRGDWGHVESFNFLGLGMLLLLAIASVSGIRQWDSTRRALRAHAALVAVLVALFAFALTNKIGGFHRYVEIPLPEPVVLLASMFRASGRMMWPVVYVIMLAAIVLVLRNLPRSAPILLTFALAVQLLDISAGWAHMRPEFEGMRSSSWSGQLRGPFWTAAAIRYDKIESINFQNHRPGWQKIARFAYEHDLGTDTVYLARVSSDGWISHRAQVRQWIRAGCFPSDTLFLVDRNKRRIVRNAIDPQRDLFAEVNGYYVLAPGWYKPHPC